MFERSFAVDSDGFQQGISDMSVGRFVGFREETPEKSSYLTFDGGDLSMWLGIQRIFYIPLPPDHTVKKSADWSGQRLVLSYEKNGKQKTTVTTSLCAPAMHINATAPSFVMRFQYGLQIQHAAFVTSKGVQITSPGEEFDGKGIAYRRSEHGDLAEPWILAWFGPENDFSTFECPLLIVLEKHPREISVRAGGGVMTMAYDAQAGNIAIMPVSGIKKYQNDETADWHKSGVPADVLKGCSYWADILQAYPTSCNESFKLNEDKATVEIRNKFSFIKNKSDWPITPKPHAPISPLIVHAKKHGYPIAVNHKLIATDLPTRHGAYHMVKGASFTYTIPYARYIDHAIAPVKIKNDPLWEPTQQKLAGYLKNPAWTFGGDYDYDRNTMMDAFHNVKILGWATWSLDEKERKERFIELSKPVRSVTPDYYHHETDPVSGLEYWWDKQIFWQAGDVNWDSEWYNGINLGSPWAYYHYGHGITTRTDLEKLWPYVDKWLTYIEMTSDWVHCNPITAIGSCQINLDGSVHALHGVIAAARAAATLGNDAMARRMKYLASKMLISWYDSWFPHDYYVEGKANGSIRPLPNLEKDFDDWCWISGYGATGPNIGDQAQRSYISCFGIVDLELLGFYNDYLREPVRKYVYELFPRHYPDWLKREHANTGRINSGPHQTNSDHANFKDPHLIARSLMFHEPIDEINKYDIEHTGQVLESFMVGSHPQVLFPVAARFGGNEWDEAAKKLTTTLIFDGADVVSLVIEWPEKPVKISGCASWEYRDGKVFANVVFAEKKEVVLDVRF